ncbi:hypothetical protein AEGHOMDF_5202 [Methylobacterium soli]|nr:hypothetical protein AEGHOMDF_5202 [Methylobacterium soli]
MPLNFMGIESCTSMVLTRTKPPIVVRPAMMSRAASHITTVMPMVKITACPAFSTASET